MAAAIGRAVVEFWACGVFDIGATVLMYDPRRDLDDAVLRAVDFPVMAEGDEGETAGDLDVFNVLFVPVQRSMVLGSGRDRDGGLVRAE